jgi:poly-gamma-glutamate capsule biosynthesis protein CapA/YwtB (metallophosphatase superfamily)
MRGRRRFLRVLGCIAAGAAALAALRVAHAGSAPQPRPSRRLQVPEAATPVTLFLCGDVMTGRAIDQILPHPSRPELHEPYARSALSYLTLAVHANGEIPRPVAFPYVWGDALAELERRRPAARIVNLETSVTRSDSPWPKGINYRMHPDNIGCLTAAGIDCCVLANNHVLDWQHQGLIETLTTLRGARIAIAGADADLEAAQAPAALPLGNGARLLVFAAATDDSGVPTEWAATSKRAGVHRLPDLSTKTVARMSRLVQRHRKPGDRVVLSLHWGGNWGYPIPRMQRAFSHGLIDDAGVDIVYGHSSHHPKAIEVYRDRLILYGCGDFLNDYEGIEGHEAYRSELGLMYFPTLDAATGRLHKLEMVPTRIRNFRVNRAGREDREWLLGGANAASSAATSTRVRKTPSSFTGNRGRQTGQSRFQGVTRASPLRRGHAKYVLHAYPHGTTAASSGSARNEAATSPVGVPHSVPACHSGYATNASQIAL